MMQTLTSCFRSRIMLITKLFSLKMLSVDLCCFQSPLVEIKSFIMTLTNIVFTSGGRPPIFSKTVLGAKFK